MSYEPDTVDVSAEPDPVIAAEMRTAALQAKARVLEERNEERQREEAQALVSDESWAASF